MEEKRRTILVVLDGLDFAYIRDHREKLPYFDGLLAQEMLAPLESVVPADSIPAWTSLYTGLNPAEHGMLESIDYLNEKTVKQPDACVIREKTIWDQVGKQGKKEFVFNKDA